MAHKRKYRLNILITYFEDVNVENYRPPLMQLLQNIAWLYELDFAISKDHDFENEIVMSEFETTDIVYFRSNSNTRIPIKDLRRIIHDLFQSSSLIFYGVNADYQVQKVLPKFPFPRLFYRFLKYPYVEVHKDDQISLSLFADAALPILGEEQAPSLN